MAQKSGSDVVDKNEGAGGLHPAGSSTAATLSLCYRILRETRLSVLNVVTPAKNANLFLIFDEYFCAKSATRLDCGGFPWRGVRAEASKIAH